MNLQRLWFVLVVVALSSLSMPMIPIVFAQNTISGAIPSSQVQFAVGAFDLYDPTTAGEGQVEWRGTFAFPAFSPLSGVLATADGGVYGFAGLYLDFKLFARFVVTPSAAIGLYAKGGGLARANTGSESILATYSVPLSSLHRQ